MARTTESVRRAPPNVQRWEPPVRRGGSLRALAGVLAAIGLVMLFWRLYQQFFAWRHLDSTTPGYRRVWVGLFVGQSVVFLAGAAAWYGWLLRTRCATCHRHEESGDLAPARHEANHIWKLWLHVAALAAVLFFAGSFFAEQDATWHQVAVRDTAFTPSHVVLFFGTFPLAIILAIGAYLYGRTRLPHIYRDRGFPLSFGLVIAGTVLLLFQVAFNEWGHSFWIAEEIFSAPLHWPFVFYGYLIVAIFAVWFQTLPRLFELAERDASARPAGPGRPAGHGAGTHAGASDR